MLLFHTREPRSLLVCASSLLLCFRLNPLPSYISCCASYLFLYVLFVFVDFCVIFSFLLVSVLFVRFLGKNK
jgi:hypothetical protein